MLRQLPVQFLVPACRRADSQKESNSQRHTHTCPLSHSRESHHVTVSVGSVPVSGGGSAQLPGGGQSSAVEEDGQVDDVPHVVVPVDVGVPQDAVQVLVDGLDDDVRVAGEDGDEGSFGEQDPHLQDDRSASPGLATDRHLGLYSILLYLDFIVLTSCRSFTLKVDYW